ncbi:MAG: recombination mediator RecR [bacterium]
MPAIPESLDNLIGELSRLPGIGNRSARRIAFHLLHKPPEDSHALADAIRRMIENVRFCSVCNSLSEKDPCDLCSDSRRDRSIICVVEEISDLLAIESTDSYRGLYHVLGGVIDPLSGIGPEQLAVQSLLERLKTDEVREIIVATNPTAEGDTTAMYLARLVRPLGVNVTRIARGLPVGGDLEFTDKSTLARALENRTAQN